MSRHVVRQASTALAALANSSYPKRPPPPPPPKKHEAATEAKNRGRIEATNQTCRLPVTHVRCTSHSTRTCLVLCPARLIANLHVTRQAKHGKARPQTWTDTGQRGKLLAQPAFCAQTSALTRLTLLTSAQTSSALLLYSCESWR